MMQTSMIGMTIMSERSNDGVSCLAEGSLLKDWPRIACSAVAMRAARAVRANRATRAIRVTRARRAPRTTRVASSCGPTEPSNSTVELIIGSVLSRSMRNQGLLMYAARSITILAHKSIKNTASMKKVIHHMGALSAFGTSRNKSSR